jgi:hypothetical protein
VGPRELSIVGLGPDQLAQRTTFTIASTSVDDVYEATNNDPFTAPVISADGDYFIILHGDCTDLGNGVVGEPESVGADCDDFFTITNTSGSTKTVSVEVDWHEDGPDPDLYIADDPFNNLIAGSFFAHPEAVEFDMAAGETVRMWINLYEDAGVDAVLQRVRVSGL